MRMLFIAALAGVSLLAQASANAQSAPQHPVSWQYSHRPIPMHICPSGTSWQYGCVQWAPAGPGQLFGACLRNAWSCKRQATPIQ
jgi:hypothetical protein